MNANDPNASRPGYKETKVGWIPEEWETVRLKKAVDPIESGTSVIGSNGSPSAKQVGVLKVSAVTSGTFLPLESKTVSGQEVDRLRCAVTSKSILVNRANGSHMLVGTAVKVDTEHENLFLPDKLWKLTTKEGISNVDFIHPILNSKRFRQKVIDLSSGGTGMMNISSKAYLSIFIPFPPLPEQQKIATILSTCDEVIEKTSDLIKAKQRQKKALMQQLLTGKKRLPGFGGEWKEAKLCEVSTRLTDVADDPDGYLVLSITAGRGFVSQADKFSRVIAGKQVGKYVLLKRGQFSYNKGNSYRYPQGCVYRLEEYDEGLVPNVFYSFDVNEERVDPEFLKQYFLAGLHNKNLYRWINSGVRNNGLLNLNASDFFELPIKLPTLDEQKSVGSVLKQADLEIRLLELRLLALQQQKKALMQKLLTGQVRVKV